MKTKYGELEAGKVYGAYDKEVETMHLQEWPLKPGHCRVYNDHTGRFFEDVTKETFDPIAEELWDIFRKEVQEEIDKYD